MRHQTEKRGNSMSKIIIGTEEITAYHGEILAEALLRAGYPVNRPCGGRGMCGKCLVTVDGEEVLACRYRVNGDIHVTLPEKKDIVSVTGVTESFTATEHQVLALDIGTTTLAMALVSLDSGKVVRRVTRTNPQTSFGADVISRIGHCMSHGASELQRVLIREINAMIRSLCLSRVPYLYAAGNTTMLHLFCGVDCSSLGKAPYTPVFLEAQTLDASSLGIEGVDTVVTLPGAAAFVGADISAGLGHIASPKDGCHSLLIDLGTNAEIVLFNRSHALCTAAAAGPCFEGANISCGMSATDGAICRVVGDDPLLCETIGHKKACGICGTGLIDVIAALLDNETIDETGFMEDGRAELAEGVFLTQADVREYQLAKSAVCSGVMTLLETAGITAADIDTVYLAGGFAAEISIRSAVRTGLLPEELTGKCVSIGNSSLLGTVDYALGNRRADAITKNMTYIDLAASPVFTAHFTDNMLFE